MHAPQIVLIVLFAISTGISATTHGQPRTGNYNFGDTIFRVALWSGILWWGGFWS